MKDTMLKPCADWIEKLAVRYPDDLAYDDRIALNKHLASCRACTIIHPFYLEIGARICNLPAVEPLPDLPYEILQLEGRSAIYKVQPASLFSGLLTWLGVSERLLHA